MERIANAGPQKVLQVGLLRSEFNLPKARVRLIDFPIQFYDVWGTLGTYRLELSLRPWKNAGAISFPRRAGARAFKPAGDTFMLLPGQFMHSAGQTSPRSAIVCDFQPDAFRDRFGRDLRLDPEASQAGLDIDSQAIRLSLRRLAEEMLSPGFAHEMLCEMLVGQVAIDLVRHCEMLVEHQWTGGLSPRRLKLIEERVAEVSAPPTLGELAELCNLSIRQLTRGFRASRKCSIGDYVAERRIESAKQLLASKAGIKEIAHRLGFASTGNFSTAFRRATGASPRQFRASLGLGRGHGWSSEA